jgi:lambda repressor-like predicted transcriptional regulator
MAITTVLRNKAVLRLRVKEVAESQGMSMGRLSRTTGLAYNTIRNIYRYPTREVNTTTLTKIARALNVPVTELIEDIPDTDE